MRIRRYNHDSIPHEASWDSSTRAKVLTLDVPSTMDDRMFSQSPEAILKIIASAIIKSAHSHPKTNKRRNSPTPWNMTNVGVRF